MKLFNLFRSSQIEFKSDLAIPSKEIANSDSLYLLVSREENFEISFACKTEIADRLNDYFRRSLSHLGVIIQLLEGSDDFVTGYRVTVNDRRHNDWVNAVMMSVFLNYLDVMKGITNLHSLNLSHVLTVPEVYRFDAESVMDFIEERDKTKPSEVVRVNFINYTYGQEGFTISQNSVSVTIGFLNDYLRMLLSTNLQTSGQAQLLKVLNDHEINLVTLR